MRRIASTVAVVVGLIAATGGTGRAQEWLLDDALRALSAETRDELKRGVSKAPERALELVLEEETEHLEALAEEDLVPFAQEAWRRLRDREDGPLLRVIRAELERARAPLGEFLRRVVAEERRRLQTLDERVVYALVDQALRRTLVERLTRLRDARFTVGRLDAWSSGPPGSVPDVDTLRNGTTTDWLMANRVMTHGVSRFSWREADTGASFDLRSDLPIPKFTVFHDEARLREVLLEREFRSDLGELKVVAAAVDGLASARVGRVTMPDTFGREVEGIGATFTARARLTGVKADVRSRDVELAAHELALRTYLSATLVDLASNVEANGTAVVTEHGAGLRAEVRAGAGVSASARLPVEIDLRVLTIRVIPYASVHAGAMAEAHASLEVAWTGTIRFDVGASVSTGVGVGAGVVVEIELGPVLKAALERVMHTLARAVRPVGDAILGRTWKGPALDSGRLTLSLADLEAGWAASGQPAPPRHVETPAQVAARFAPVLYQRVNDEHDFIRRVDFDGDWVATNNWEHAEGGDRTAWVYYHVKETATHWFVTYTLYHARRVSEAIQPLRNLRRHENDLGGCVVVARKGAPRGREVELLLTTEGERLHGYGPAKDARWSRRDGWWHGEVKFVDEVDHPLFDMERTHPQVWVDDKSHDVRGFTGRDDGDPFSGERGVVYVPTGTAEAPEGARDLHVGYALRPLDELLAHAGDPAAFTTDDTVRPRGATRAYARRMRGDEGLDDSAVPPWAWHSAAHGEYEELGGERERRPRDPARTILEGDLFVDPARVVSILYDTPDDFGREYVRAPSRGMAAALPGN